MEPVHSGAEDRAPPALADHLLEEIFVRIRAPDDLACASAACKAFRHLITDSTFLRRYRSLHPPLLLGFVDRWSSVRFLPADAPRPNARAARALVGAADFSVGHLPYRRNGFWSACDARDGRVLLMRYEPGRGLILPELAVCDPLTQGYKLLPPIPDGVFASFSVHVQNQYVDINIFEVDAFFDPSGSYNEEQFRVMWWTRCPTMGVIFVYASSSGSWTHGASIGVDAPGLDTELMQPNVEDMPEQWPGYAFGFWYWKPHGSNKLIKLNVNNMEFSIVSLPPDYENQHVIVTEAREAEGYIFIIGSRRDRTQISAYFSLEIKTMKVETVYLSHHVPLRLIPYFGFLPFMSLRRM